MDAGPLKEAIEMKSPTLGQMKWLTRPDGAVVLGDVKKLVVGGNTSGFWERSLENFIKSTPEAINNIRGTYSSTLLSFLNA